MRFGLRDNVFYMGDHFTTANRYPRQVANAADTVLTMVQGPSINFVVSGTGSVTRAAYWRFECGALTFFNDPTTASGFAVDRPIGV